MRVFQWHSSEVVGAESKRKMFIFVGILILVIYFCIRQYLTESFSYFDRRKLKSIKPTLKGLITMQSMSFPELISLSYNSLKGEK